MYKHVLCPYLTSPLGGLTCWYLGRFKHLYADTDAGEAVVYLHHVALATEAVAIAVAPSRAVPQLRCLDLICLHGLRGEGHLLKVGVSQNHDLHWTPSHPSAIAKQGQDLLLIAQMGRRGWSHMKTVLQIQGSEFIHQCRYQWANYLLSWCWGALLLFEVIWCLNAG